VPCLLFQNPGSATDLAELESDPSDISTGILGSMKMSNLTFYPMPEISDFQRTNSEFAKSEQKYPVKITLEYAHYD
jgi:hypothetical protein